MKSNITAIWQGSFKEGNGQLTAENSKLNNTSFKPSYAKNDGSFTNPEELGSIPKVATCFFAKWPHLSLQSVQSVSPESVHSADFKTF